MLRIEERIQEASRKIIANDPSPIDFAKSAVDAALTAGQDVDHDRGTERLHR